MKIGARNQLAGTVTAITPGAANPASPAAALQVTGVTANQVTIAAGPRPACNQHGQQRTARSGCLQPSKAFLHVEKAGIVLTPLADDNFFAPF